MASDWARSLVSQYSFQLGYGSASNWSDADESNVLLLKTSGSVVAFANIKTMQQAMDYAINSAKAAKFGVCLSQFKVYMAAALIIAHLKAMGGSVTTAKTVIEQADAVCRAASDYKKTPASTAGRVVTPEVTTPTPAVPKATDIVPPAAEAGFSPWLLIGGLGLAVLLFGKPAKSSGKTTARRTPVRKASRKRR